MSNFAKRRKRPLPYTCSHCSSRCLGVRTINGVERLTVSHDPECPVLTGKVSGHHDTLRAVRKSGRRAAILTPEGIYVFLGSGGE